MKNYEEMNKEELIEVINKYKKCLEEISEENPEMNKDFLENNDSYHCGNEDDYAQSMSDYCCGTIGNKARKVLEI